MFKPALRSKIDNPKKIMTTQMQKTPHIYKVFITALLACQIAFANAGFAVIGNPGDEFATLSEQQVKDIYLGKLSILPGGTIVKAADLGDSNAVRNEFYLKITGKNPTQIKTHWAKLVFADKGTPPVALQDDNAVKQWVAAKRGRIGYVSDSAVDNTVKVLLRLP